MCGITQAAPNLEFLDVRGNSKEWEFSLNFPLECIQLTSVTLFQLANFCPKLEVLEMRGNIFFVIFWEISEKIL